MIARRRNTSAQPGSAARPPESGPAMEQVRVGAGEEFLAKAPARLEEGCKSAHQASPASRRRNAAWDRPGHPAIARRRASRRLKGIGDCCHAQWVKQSARSANSSPPRRHAAGTHIEVNNSPVGAGGFPQRGRRGIVEHKHVGAHRAGRRNCRVIVVATGSSGCGRPCAGLPGVRLRHRVS